MVIDTEKVYKSIKKQNGEAFAKVLRENVLLDIPNLKHILEFAGNNPKDAGNLIGILRELRSKSGKTTQPLESQKDPLELLSDAGYDAFYVENLTQQNSIRKYFEPNEELCTFRDSERYKNFYIIHAVKKDVKNIKRDKEPFRESPYGTSVISIQIAKGGGFISIKNRYNHTVNDPDATFNNNPDNIIPGLTAALKKKFNVDFMTANVEIPINYRLINDQLVRFNYESDNIYFGEKYYFIGSKITKLNTDYEVMLDNVILNTKTGKLSSPVKHSAWLPASLNIFQQEMAGQKIKISKDKTTGETVIYLIDKDNNTEEFLRTKNGCTTVWHLYKTTDIQDIGRFHETMLREVYAPHLKTMGWNVFGGCPNIEVLYAPELEEMGNFCFGQNEVLKKLYLPKLKTMNDGCFWYNKVIEILYAPELKEMGKNCFNYRVGFGGATPLKALFVPKLKINQNIPECIKSFLKQARFIQAIKNTLHLQKPDAVYKPDLTHSR